MKIGIDASRANKKHKTGVEWYSYHLIEQFKKIDHQNQYFLYANEPLRGALAEMPDNFQEAVLKWPIPRTWTVLRLSWEMLVGRKKCDTLFVPAHTIPLFNPERSVVTVHDIGFEHFPECYQTADKFYHKLIIHFIKKSADQIITVSEYSKRDLIETYKIDPAKIKVVYNGYDQERYREMPDAKTYIRNKFEINAPYILFVGRLEEKKNISRLIDAFNLFKKQNPQDDHKLVLVGSCGFGFEQAQKKIGEYGLQKEIIFPGWLDDHDLPYLHSASDLFVFPSLFEGFGIPILEAMACGEPVVCSNTTSLPEVAGDATIMFDPTDIEQMSAVMARVLLNPRTASDLREKGLARTKLFSWEKCAIQTHKILLENKKDGAQ